MNGRILAIDTSTEACSVALLQRGIVTARHEIAGRQAARRVLPLVEAVLAEGGCRLADLDALAAGIGPGGFTGVRLGIAVVQGLAFGAALPVVPIDSLETLAFAALSGADGDEVVLACLDARMGGIYWGCYRSDAGLGVRAVEGPALGKPALVERHLRPRAFPAVGRGMRLMQAAGSWPAACDANALPHASDLVRLAALRLDRGGGIDPAGLVPLYLRDRVALTESERRSDQPPALD